MVVILKLKNLIREMKQIIEINKVLKKSDQQCIDKIQTNWVGLVERLDVEKIIRKWELMIKSKDPTDLIIY